jgi:hypothetical protein
MFFESLDQIQPFFRSLFSPCVSFFQLFAIPQRLKPESLNESFAARLKSCPDTFNRLKVFLQVAPMA